MKVPQATFLHQLRQRPSFPVGAAGRGLGVFTDALVQQVVFKHRCFANAQSTGVIGRGIRFTKALPLIGGEEGVYCTHVVQWMSGFSSQVDATAGQGQQGSDAGESQHFCFAELPPSKLWLQPFGPRYHCTLTTSLSPSSMFYTTKKATNTHRPTSEPRLKYYNPIRT
jgi:hypothetical protein